MEVPSTHVKYTIIYGNFQIKVRKKQKRAQRSPSVTLGLEGAGGVITADMINVGHQESET